MAKLNKELFELIPVVSSGEYVCEEQKCKVMQTNEDEEDILFSGSDNGMYCRKHIEAHAKPVKI